MSTTLPINATIVPEKVTRGYLEVANTKTGETTPRYDAKTEKNIEELFQQIKKEAQSRITDAPKPGASVFVLVAGSQGVGKTNMVEQLIKQSPQQHIVCDVDSILLRMPQVKEAINDVQTDVRILFETAGQYDANSHRKALDAAVERMRPAAKYISDRLMSEAVEEGYNVIVETNAKTPNIKSFLDCVKKSGAVLVGHICEAPLSVKENGAKSPQHGFSFPADVLKAEHEAFRKNIPVIAAACDSSLTIWWRQKPDAALQAAAIGTKTNFTADLVAKTGFEAHFADAGGLTLSKLMGQRKEIRFDPAPAPRAQAI